MFKATIKELEKGVFLAKSEDGRIMLIDARPNEVRSGFTPMELILIAAAGCTAIDVSSILRKMRQNYSELKIEIEGQRAEDYPKIYKNVKITYRVSGDNVSYDKVERAVELSQEKYCSASITLKKSGAKIEYDIKLETP